MVESSLVDLVFEKFKLVIPGKPNREVSGAVGAAERVILSGPSGCGKTTLLRAIAGLRAPASGDLRLGDRNLTALPPNARRVGLVFQSGALFPHLDVLGNICFGLNYLPKANDWSLSLKQDRARDFLVHAGLEGFAARDVVSLSGGERQRVALLRTLICEPECLLLDEPLSAVDPGRREELQDWILSRLSERPVPTLVVTHDEREAARLGTRRVMWDEGTTCLNF
ncbi:MAG: ATP-binding cassette domain-containing protein [Bdellovibrionales bacterium]|nr:ATP-binding cassette domain-containing protein [Bdellovibrionales bacterium]